MTGVQQWAVQRMRFFLTERATLMRLRLAVISMDLTGQGRKRRSNRRKAVLNVFHMTLGGRLCTGWDAPKLRKPSHTFKLALPRWPLIVLDHRYLWLGTKISAPCWSNRHWQPVVQIEGAGSP